MIIASDDDIALAMRCCIMLDVPAERYWEIVHRICDLQPGTIFDRIAASPDYFFRAIEQMRGS